MFAETFDNRLSEPEIKLAQRFAHLWFFRYEVRLRFYGHRTNGLRYAPCHETLREALGRTRLSGSI
jgi:hypothetical protein